ncbi:hypothetical protein PPTG_22454 [Phytophthora nicotianae INRA-310]|uniref:Uncharacterized protein n=1 Tax=Phytophthora nicotianae (strain INRA-310) TaxID=761204 RepID=W2QGZ5_PHYN3|nr:hypothetical protein PPTG_22454 [Phytophthora nicotianae INRA-310]ETN12141.1 hypothetical protein PPTG_22454 [Phytophthora nicotianae INRA-310]
MMKVAVANLHREPRLNMIECGASKQKKTTVTQAQRRMCLPIPLDDELCSCLAGAACASCCLAGAQAAEEDRYRRDYYAYPARRVPHNKHKHHDVLRRCSLLRLWSLLHRLLHQRQRPSQTGWKPPPSPPESQDECCLRRASHRQSWTTSEIYSTIATSIHLRPPPAVRQDIICSNTKRTRLLARCVKVTAISTAGAATAETVNAQIAAVDGPSIISIMAPLDSPENPKQPFQEV